MSEQKQQPMQQQMQQQFPGQFPWAPANNLAGAPSWQMQNLIAADVSHNLFRPIAPEAASLAALKELNYFLRKPDELDDSVKAIFEFESQFLKAGMKAVSENATLRAKFGGGLAGASAVASLLKQEHSERALKTHLSQYVPEITVLEETDGDEY